MWNVNGRLSDSGRDRLKVAPRFFKQEPNLAEIQKAGESAAVLTRQLLAFSRRQIIDPALLNLNVVVTGRQLSALQIELILDASGSMWGRVGGRPRDRQCKRRNGEDRREPARGH